MLSPYHISFLRLLNKYGVPYLVGGGQARHWEKGEQGHDLDVWVRYSGTDRPQIVRAMLAWAEEHRTHLNDWFRDLLSRDLHDGFQIKSPEFEGVGYMVDGEPRMISPREGIDVLIGGFYQPTFDECYGRAVLREVEGLTVPVLSRDDDRDLLQFVAERDRRSEPAMCPQTF